MNQLNEFKYDILAAISGLQTREETPYGLGIKRELQAGDYDEVNHGRLYPQLNQLSTAGYVEKTAVDDRTNAYELTHEGMGALRDRIGGLQDMMDGKTGAEA